MLRVLGRCGAALIAVGVLASPAMANPVTGGTLSPITLEGGGTISGSLTLDAAGTGIADWNIVTTGSTVNGVTFADFTYNSTNSSVIFNNAFNFGGRTLATLDIRTPTYNSNTTGGRDLGLFFEAIPATIPAQGVALEICSNGGILCADPLFTSIRSGEIVRTPSASDPFGVGIRQVTSGFFTISDPPGSISLNFTLTPVLIPVDGGTGGGGETNVPEPGVLAQLGTSAAFVFGMIVRRRKA